MKKMNIALIGNPNCGKTTLFNAYTGEKLKVANYPGVTIEKRECEIMFKNTEIKIIDLPGVYSLNSYSIEEKLSKKVIEEENIDVIINIVDASALERNLYLTLQLIESKKNIVIALNMMDIVKKRGMNIDTDILERRLGVKVVKISAKRREGLEELIETAINEQIINEKIIIKKDTEEEINRKYNFIEYLAEECVKNKPKKEKTTEKIDEFFTNKILGFPIFITIMGIVFFLTFYVGDVIKNYFEIILEIISDIFIYILNNIGIGQVTKSLLIDGIIGGVGGVLVFLPNIFILFLCLAILEDTGYMARVAYIMNGIMNKIGLSGKACIPMILGFGCSVPAVMATRTLKNEKERLKAISLIPCMSCSAKIPIYVLFTEIFFKNNKTLIAVSMYLIGIIIAIIIGIIGNKTLEEKEELIIELPEYKIPDYNSIKIYVREKIKEYISKAGTTILIASVIIWGLLNIGKSGYVENIEDSIGAVIGKYIVHILKPIGLGYWQISVALISGLTAKEVVVSTLKVLYGNVSLYDALKTQGFEEINAYCLMLFCLLYTPCIATIATIKAETKSIKFTLKIVLFQLLSAWIITGIVYQIGEN